ncbi:hypothetical protein VNO80_02966 [Phaseolus coccineus]|uniref:Uncharacterized protein n=1 Tax=Phaseolus coccineus TaxID=3886 RepID=A0AAN9RID8_PHACN
MSLPGDARMPRAMAINKEEVVRAKEIAEQRMQNKDFNGARKFALKAHQERIGVLVGSWELDPVSLLMHMEEIVVPGDLDGNIGHGPSSRNGTRYIEIC